jgi:HAD superfamily hydrolase (TIGR01490 family)
MSKLAVFDLDGTLYDGNIIAGFLVHHRQHQVNRLQLYSYFASHSLLIPLWKIGLLPEVTMRELWARNLSWATSGMSKQTGDNCFEWIAEHYVAPLTRQDVQAIAMQHLRDGFRVILVSGTPAPLLENIAQKLGIQESVGTPLKMTNGNYTGKVELPVCQGEGKVARLKLFLGENINSVDWQASYAYADSFTDKPLLSIFGHPVAVYPDPKLAVEAKQQNWAIWGDVREPKARKFHGSKRE